MELRFQPPPANPFPHQPQRKRQGPTRPKFSQRIPTRSNTCLAMHLLHICCLLMCARFATGQNLKTSLPPFDRVWRSGDYKQASKLLRSGKIGLPTLANEEGRRFLARFTSEENLAFSRDSAVSSLKRFTELNRVIGDIGAVFALYYKAIKARKNVHAELAQVSAFTLRFAAEEVSLIDEVSPQVPKGVSYPKLMDDLRKAKFALGDAYLDVAAGLSEESSFTSADRSLVLSTMAETLPALKTAFTRDERNELRQDFTAWGSVLTEKRDMDSIQKMIKAISLETTADGE